MQQPKPKRGGIKNFSVFSRKRPNSTERADLRKRLSKLTLPAQGIIGEKLIGRRKGDLLAPRELNKMRHYQLIKDVPVEKHPLDAKLISLFTAAKQKGKTFSTVTEFSRYCLGAVPGASQTALEVRMRVLIHAGKIDDIRGVKAETKPKPEHISTFARRPVNELKHDPRYAPFLPLQNGVLRELWRAEQKKPRPDPEKLAILETVIVSMNPKKEPEKILAFLKK